MIWPFRPDNWREAGKFAQETFAKVAEAIVGATPVYMAVPEQFMVQAKAISQRQSR
jgi:agmatine deiminase